MTVTAADAGAADAGEPAAGADDAGIEDGGAADAGLESPRSLEIGCGCSGGGAPLLLAILLAGWRRRA